MTTDEKKSEILKLLKRDGIVKVSLLSEMFDTSEVTIRNYLSDMESKGLLSRVHGGAVSSYRPYYSMNLSQRLETNQEEKLSIAKKVSEMVSPNETIMLNSGTTTLLVFRALPYNYNLNIVTNSISIALEASSNPNFNVVLIGGSVNNKYQFTYGSDAVTQIESYHADKLILSVDGVDLNYGLTTYYDKETSVDKSMLSCADTKIIATDLTKFSRKAFAKICDIDEIDMIVTNSKIQKDIIKQFESIGKTVVLS